MIAFVSDELASDAAQATCPAPVWPFGGPFRAGPVGSSPAQEEIGLRDVHPMNHGAQGRPRAFTAGDQRSPGCLNQHNGHAVRPAALMPCVQSFAASEPAVPPPPTKTFLIGRMRRKHPKKPVLSTGDQPHLQEEIVRKRGA
jgi:hypothetical protein